MASSAIATSAGTVAGALRSDSISRLLTAPTIILGVSEQAELVRFYEQAYSQSPEQALVYARR